MGCIRSKPIHRQDENEDGYIFNDIDESQSNGFRLDIVEESTSFESIGDGDAVEALDLEAGQTESCADDNTKEKSVDDYALAKRMTLLRDIAELQMTQHRLARDRFHQSIIQRDARRVVESLKSHPFYHEDSEDIQTNGEMSLTGDDATALKETNSKDKSLAKEVTIWLLDVVLNNIDYDAQKVEEEEEQKLEQEEEQKQEEKCDDEDTEVPDLGFFQLRRSDKTRMTIRGHSRLSPPSSVHIGQPIENEMIHLDGYNNLNAPHQVYSHDITTNLNQSQLNDEESSNDEDREKRRLQ